MITFLQAQSIYDYGIRAYGQAFDKSRQEAVNTAATVAAAATTVANKEAKMAAKTKQAVLAAGMEATVFNAHLSGNAFTVAFDKQFVLSFKDALERLFNVEHIKQEEHQLFIFGKGYYGIGQYPEAIAALTTAMEEDPSCRANACYYLAKSHLCMKNYAVAAALFIRLTSVETDPTLLSDYYDSIGMCYFQQKLYPEALIKFELALHNNSMNSSARHNLVSLYLALSTQLKTNGEPFEQYHLKSQYLLKQLCDKTPNCPLALHMQASWYELVEDYEQAINYYLQSRAHCTIKEKNTLAAITANLAECYAQLGHGFYQTHDYASAEMAYKRALDEDAQHDIAKSQLGMCLFKLGDCHGARLHFNTLINFPLSTTPSEQELENNQVIRADAWMNRAACLRKTRNFNLAKGSLAIAKDYAPDDTTLPDENRELAATIIQNKWRFFQQTKQPASQAQNVSMPAEDISLGQTACSF